MCSKAILASLSDFSLPVIYVPTAGVWCLEPELFFRDSVNETDFSDFSEAKKTLYGFILTWKLIATKRVELCRHVSCPSMRNVFCGFNVKTVPHWDIGQAFSQMSGYRKSGEHHEIILVSHVWCEWLGLSEKSRSWGWYVRATPWIPIKFGPVVVEVCFRVGLDSLSRWLSIQELWHFWGCKIRSKCGLVFVRFSN